MLTPNETRNERAYRTLVYYQQLHPDRFDETSSVIGDLLTDLRHLCDDYNVDLADRLRFAEECYAEEIEEDGLRIVNAYGPGPAIVMPDEGANRAR